MLTNKDYCDYDTCVALYELGLSFDDASQTFERNILTNRYEEIPKSLLYEAQKWLREEKKIEIVILGDNYIGGPYHVDIYAESGPIYLDRGNAHSFYESALLEGIKEVIKILKEGK